MSHPALKMRTMESQLTLLDPDDKTWRLDEDTREVGRRGVAAARAALEASRRPAVDDHDAHPTAA
jgi:hypothetical protein